MALLQDDMDTMTVLHNPSHKFIPEESIIAVFRRVCIYSGSSDAIISGGSKLTYSELDNLSDQLADKLRCYAEKRIALLLERGELPVIGILAILKAGAVYVPVDPSYPDERLHYILADADAAVLLTTRQHAGRQARCPELLLDTLPVQSGATKSSLPLPKAAHPAYVMYTSGSTGEPKGVEVMQAGIRRLICHNDPIPILPGDRVAQAGNLAFDASTWEIWGALLNGAALVILPYETVIDSQALAQALTDNRITHAWFTVALFNQLASDMPGAFGNLRHLLVGGDALTPSTIAAVLGSDTPPANVWNGYGPTENTTFTTLHPITLGDCEQPSIPIGRPIVNTCCYVLDDNLRPVPVGAVGELYTSGEGLARGYLNKPDRTAESFIANPFYSRDAVRSRTPATPVMYRTGDRVRWLEDGTLEFVGRADQQVKIRGYRIEPGEVENQLLQLPEVRQAVVVVVERGGEKQLAAYCVSDISGQAILTAFRKQVPAHMVPAGMNVLERLPLTANGKVDKRRLPPPCYGQAGDAEDTLRTDTEHRLATIWRELLGESCKPGRSTPFFAVGGHSLMAVKMQHRILALLGKKIALRTIFTQLTLADLAAEIDKYPVASGKTWMTGLETEKSHFPLSDAQERVWLIEQKQPGTSLYHINAAFLIHDGVPDEAALNAALRDVQQRHKALQVGITTLNGEPRQVLNDEVIATRTILVESDCALRERIQRESDFPFTFDGRLLWRVNIFKENGVARALSFDFHHLIIDGWSYGVFLKELNAFYSSYRGHGINKLPPVHHHHTDYCVWEREHDYSRALSFWNRRLDEITPSALPQSVNAHFDTLESDEEILIFNAADAGKIIDASRRYHAGLLNILKCGLALVISRYSGVADITFCTVWANRTLAGLDSSVGMFANTLLSRTKVDMTTSVHDYLTLNGEELIGDFEFGNVPLSKVYGSLSQNPGYPSLSEICAVMLVLQNTDGGEGKSGALSGLELTPVALRPELAKFDITVSVFETTDRALKITFNYRKRLYSSALIKRFMSAYAKALMLLSGENSRLSGMDLSASEDKTFLSLHSAPPQVESVKNSIIQIWKHQVLLTPGAPAVRCSGETFSYQHIDAQSDLLARYLPAMRHKRVALLLERSELPIIAILAILKAGAVYVPVDPSYPDERLDYILADSGTAMLLTTRQHAGRQARCPELLLDALPPQPACASVPSHLAGADLPAYIMYTSGSTGEPKGVEVMQAGIRRLVCHNDPIAILPGDRVAQAGNLAFDASTWEIWGALLNGAALVILPYETVIDGPALAQALTDNRITHAWFTVALFNQLAAEMPGAFGHLRHLLIGGDALTPSIVASVLGSDTPPANVWNGYGPTENTTFTTLHRISAEDCAQASIPIGRPIVNTCCYVLDSTLHPVPVGAVGELFTSGEGLARRYLNKPDRTAESFIANPFYSRDKICARTPATPVMYRTGDRVRWREDGTLEFVGRADQQVKIRGYRIEPGEVENQLLQLPEVRQAVVLVTMRGGEKQLVAYCVSDMSAPFILQAFRQRVPAYMVPAGLNVLERLPLTANGKVDKRRLPPPGYGQAVEAEDTLKTDTEHRLAQIWCELLGDSCKPGRSTSFFEAGGNSLMVVKMVRKIEINCHQHVSIADIFRLATIEKISEAIDGQNTFFDETPALMASDFSAFTLDDFPRVASSSKQHHILLTGVTGFFGIHLLSALQRKAPLAISHCLIRANDEAQALTRLKAAADKYQVAVDLSKIAVLPGDLKLPSMGLEAAQIAVLEQTIDSIYHCGAWVNHLHTYAMLRDANVGSTKALISLCREGKKKSLFYVSTLSAASHEEGVIKEQGVAPVCPADSGYVQSKWVSERLLEKHFLRGLHGKIYRMGNITGDTRFGISNVAENHYLNLVKGCIQSGYAPAWDMLYDLSPVDMLADMLVSDSLRAESEQTFLNLAYITSVKWLDFIAFLKAKGHAMTIETPESWIKKCVDVLDENNALYPFKSFYEKPVVELNMLVENSAVLKQKVKINSDYLLNLYYRYWKTSCFIDV